MKRTIILFRDYGEVSPLVITSEDGIDCKKAVEAAAKQAAEDGIVSQVSGIPEKYFQAQGLTVDHGAEVIEMGSFRTGTTALEKLGYGIARCRHCNSFEEGSCYRYGGTCNPDAANLDCLHGDCIAVLSPKGKPGAGVCIELDDICGEEMLEEVREQISEITKALRECEEEDIREMFSGFSEEELEDPDGWDIRPTR